MPVENLDAESVRNAKCTEGKKRTDYFDKSIKGFVLEVRANGRKTLALRYRDSYKRQRQQKLGDPEIIPVEKARAMALKILARILLGEDPAAERRIKRSTPTIAENCRDSYLPYIQSYRRNMQSDISFINNHLLPMFGRKHLDQLTTQDVIDAQQSMLKAGYAPGTANKFIVQVRYLCR